MSTKTGSRVRPHIFTYDHTMESVETSLELLQVDTFDVMLVHDPRDIEEVFAPNGALRALKELKAQGTIRAIGLGCRPHAFHQRCFESTGAPRCVCENHMFLPGRAGFVSFSQIFGDPLSLIKIIVEVINI